MSNFYLTKCCNEKKLPTSFDSASARTQWKATAYYTGGYATSDKDLAKKMRTTLIFKNTPNLRKLKDILIKKIIKLRKKQ